MKTGEKTAFLLLLLIIIASCASQTKDALNRDNLMKLELGMTREQVIQIMGKPDFTEAYQKPGGVSETFFYYTKTRRVDTYRRWPDDTITQDECTPVEFEHGKLIGWGDEFYQRKRKVEFELKR